MSHRFEHEDQTRRDRARAHLARVRDRRAEHRVVWKRRTPREDPPARPMRRGEVVLVLAASMLAGSLLGDGWLVFARDVLESRPPALTRIAVEGARQLSPRSVATATGVAPGTPLAELDEARIEDNLTAQPWIRAARARRLPGGSLVVSVDERIPSATTLAGEPARVFAVDAMGAVFAPAPEHAGALPRLVLSEEPTLGEEDPARARAIEIGSWLPDHGLATPREIGVATDDRGFTLRFAGLDTEFVLGSVDLPARLDRLSRLLAQRPAEVAAAARVDLRFEDQVVLQKGEAREGSLHNATSRGDAAARGTRHAG